MEQKRKDWAALHAALSHDYQQQYGKDSGEVYHINGQLVAVIVELLKGDKFARDFHRTEILAQINRGHRLIEAENALKLRQPEPPATCDEE